MTRLRAHIPSACPLSKAALNECAVEIHPFEKKAHNVCYQDP